MEDSQKLYDEIVDKLINDYVYNEEVYGKATPELMEKVIAEYKNR